MIDDPRTPRPAAAAVRQVRDDARQQRAYARGARHAAAVMAADDTERRVRMGELLWRLYHLRADLRADLRAEGAAGEPTFPEL